MHAVGSARVTLDLTRSPHNRAESLLLLPFSVYPQRCAVFKGSTSGTSRNLPRTWGERSGGDQP